jgi:UDP-2,4-diacetamido-2,4,6-trideoxy-beta-L-altropyranose hydrolase
MPRFILRCDASMAIGSGHVMRCATLAAQLRERGADVEFACRDLPAFLRERIVAAGAGRVHGLPERSNPGPGDGEPVLPHRAWLAVTQAADAADTLEIVRAGPRPDWLIVDHYALDARWERALRPHVRNILAIDDLADRDHDCDLLLDQNFFLEPGPRYARRLPRAADMLLGPRFALLRPEFPAMRERQPERDGALRRLFVSFGSFDPANQTSLALRAIAAAGLGELAVDVVIGRDNPHRAEIEALCRKLQQCQLHVDAESMAALMAAADLAIGASGATNWERCCLRLPSLLVSVAENQHPIARDLDAAGVCLFLGRSDAVTANSIASALRRIAASPGLARELGARAGALTDGQGARRVTSRLLPEPIRLRPAQPSDCGPMHAWRNAEETRRYAFDPAPIDLDIHRRWFEQVLLKPGVALLVGERDPGPVGVLRYDLNGGEAKISVYLVPGMQGQGLGTALLVAGTRWLRNRHPEVQRIVAEVRDDNTASFEAFANAGFRPGHQNLVLDLGHDQRA